MAADDRTTSEIGVVVLADDLTGALDSAAPFCGPGWRVRVATSPDAIGPARVGADVLAVSTRTREAAPEAAAAAVMSARTAIPTGARLFKKVDSRLKGPIAAELAALGEDEVLAVPAIPSFGRIVRDGSLQGWGVDTPMPVADRLGRRAHVPDTLSDRDIDRALADHPGALIVGARGAAQALARALGAGGAATPALRLPLLIAVGSTDPITAAQVASLCEGCTGLAVAPAPDGHLEALPAPAPVTLLQAVPGAGAPGDIVARRFARTVASLAPRMATLVLTGGATAEAALDALGIRVLDLSGEVLPGLPLAVAGSWRIVTKSGGFGDASTLLDLARRATL